MSPRTQRDTDLVDLRLRSTVWLPDNNSAVRSAVRTKKRGNIDIRLLNELVLWRFSVGA